jgi:multicomponent Na+:H+ antiporter subunit C
MPQATWFVAVGATLLGLGIARLALSADWIVRLLGLNVAGAGALVILVAMAARGGSPDPVPHALALTGIVITFAVTALGLVLSRLLSAYEAGTDAGQDP